MPVLRDFLWDGEAESYWNVEVKYISGRKATMTVWEGDSMDARKDWVEREKIVLSNYNTKEELHALMVEKGFQPKSEEEIEAARVQKIKDDRIKIQKYQERKEEERLQAAKAEEIKAKRDRLRAERERTERSEEEPEGMKMKKYEL
mmetsp:Transcript_23/g.63  ORF Transcript_23/g.63 Transcript_23/m.63 type:complete len:146 (+) Transcript_23:193-630(+)